MKKPAKSIGKLIILGLFVIVAIFYTTKKAQAIPMASVTYNETWDGTEWDYTYFVENQSTGGEYVFDLFLDTFGSGANLTNISDPTDWENWTDNSTYIEWDSIPFTGSEIAPGSQLAFTFSSDMLLGDLYYEVLFDDFIGGFSMVSGTSAPPVPEPATILLLGAGLAGMAGLKKRKKNGLNA